VFSKRKLNFHGTFPVRNFYLFPVVCTGFPGQQTGTRMVILCLHLMLANNRNLTRALL